MGSKNELQKRAQLISLWEKRRYCIDETWIGGYEKEQAWVLKYKRQSKKISIWGRWLSWKKSPRM